MPELEKILVPVDFSECSARALALAQTFAERTGGTIDVLHVWRTPTFVPVGVMIVPESGEQQSLAEVVERAARTEFEAFVKAQREAGIAIANVKMEEGDPWQVISSVAEKHGYGLIVMGTHGRSGLMHVLMGSVAERVVRQSSVPVLTVRGPSSRQ
jgi:nucleotide-binding universal stress UspA family protein